ncbi:heterokaryon incompatibility protein-domain-containing protein [Cercophora samala]|uniref:Heterokaryon incompatibility protein-domain-containing protein n=1 Tax=Cercophora samala TaxID=330535 RepID=A0AA39ZEA7_9PEZI|nr:heterokaryon incompatibility protein-domain-containing protein [Cercophora samala]
MKMFPYMPLDHNRREIRLLKLNFANPPLSDENVDDSPWINLSMSHASLDDVPAPRYAALSYVWGNPNDTLPITLDGQPFQVTENLFTALDRLLAMGYSDCIWIDAICINQSDSDEKAVQVQLMSSVYSLATMVFVWLGPEPDEGAFRTIRTVARMYRKATRSKTEEEHGDDGHRRQPVTRVAETVVKVADRIEQLNFQALAELISGRPWWHRVWVIQEVVLAREVLVLCGEEMLPWRDLKDTMAVLIEMGALQELQADEYADLSRAVTSILLTSSHLRAATADYEASLLSVQQQAEGEVGLTLFKSLDLLFLYNNTIEATDERDMIYGILGLVKPQDRGRIPVDYSSAHTVERVFFDVTKVLLMKHGPNVLSRYQRLFSVKNHPAAIPSWIVDWTSEFLTALDVKVEDRDDYIGMYQTTKGTTWEEWSAKAQISKASYEEPRISLRGRIVGRVVNVGKTLVSPTVPKPTVYKPSPEYVAVAREWLLELIDMLETYRASLTGNSDDASKNFLTSALENVWRVPLLDCDGDNRVDDSIEELYIAGFEALTDKNEKEPGKLWELWDQGVAEVYIDACQIQKRRSFVDSMGRPGVSLQDVQAGDQVVVFPGAHVPFVIRPATEKGGIVLHHVVGAAYIYKLMDGEAMEDGSEFQEIWLV